MVWLSHNVFPHVRLLCNYLEQKGVKRGCSLMMTPRRSLSDDGSGLDVSSSPAHKPVPAILDAPPLPIASSEPGHPVNSLVTLVAPSPPARSANPIVPVNVDTAAEVADRNGIDDVIAHCLQVMGGRNAPANKAAAKGTAKAKAKANAMSAATTVPKAKAKGKGKAHAKAKAMADQKASAAKTRAHVKASSTAGSATKVQLIDGTWVRLGCPKCRGNPVGCVQCRNPKFNGNRWTRST